MKILRTVAISLAVIAVLLFAIGFLLPDKAHVERTVLVNAGPAQIFPYVNDFRLFNQWQPWAQLDPSTEYRYSGPSSGVGARMEWTSHNPNVGHGSQEIVSSNQDNRVEMLLDFGTEGVAQAYIQLQPENGATRVTWGFDTDFKGSIVARYFGLMFDSWLGKDYEKGLANLKALAEAAAVK